MWKVTWDGVQKPVFALPTHCIVYSMRTHRPAALLTSSPVMSSGCVSPPLPLPPPTPSPVNSGQWQDWVCECADWWAVSWTIVNGNWCDLGGQSAVLSCPSSKRHPAAKNSYTNILDLRRRTVWPRRSTPARACDSISPLGKKTIVSPPSSLLRHIERKRRKMLWPKLPHMIAKSSQGDPTLMAESEYFFLYRVHRIIIT